MRELVMIHGRSQQGYDPDKLKQHWLDALEVGLRANGLSLPIDQDKIHFPFYGDTLAGMTNDIPEEEVAQVIVRGDDSSEAETEFVRTMLLETVEQFGISEEAIQSESEERIVERGILNSKWVLSALRALDRHVPGASSTSVSIATKDVYRYLTHPAIMRVIDNGVRKAFTPGVETVVLSHSLGTVVAYNVLRKYGDTDGWKIPLLVTVGCPLGVQVIKNTLKPITFPKCVSTWFNAMDPRDVVALYPLDKKNFDVSPAIENKVNVKNESENRHAISGYLSDPVVAKRLYDAITV